MKHIHNLKAQTVEDIPLTSAEVIELDASRADQLAAKPLKIWLGAMSASDATVSRQLEDIYDVLTATQQGNLATETAEKIAAKKLLRSQRPA